jgi:transcriptional regulator with XRE-family HTH domain
MSTPMDRRFSDWLNQEMQKHNWSQSDLARASGLSRQVISYYLSDKSKSPDENALQKLAHAFKLPVETVFRAAGILPQQIPENETIEQITHLTKELPPQEQQDILEFIKLRHRLSEQREKNETKRTRN